MSIESSLTHHLQYNHFPPVDEAWVPVAARAIKKAQRELDSAYPLKAKLWGPGAPRVRRPKPWGGLVYVGDVIKGLHLDFYLTNPWDEMPELDPDGEAAH